MEYLIVYLVSVVLSAYLIYVLSERTYEYPDIFSFVILTLIPLLNTVAIIYLSLVLLAIVVHEKLPKSTTNVESLLKTIFRHKDK